ncbi:helix-turn-helix domain-containing protein [Aliarcobacter butzleri]|uniref:helix-turn-helix domain-containing protein n=1 Tax=Aliarcobacter butzleri TaxID=28197 RepID=UPI001EDB3516|nr:helix-turn-helix transcriptional regulator [Aliarcobacter butzleri]MCG3657961.1 helix-turn-helix transcriptional regulator [Aliarcobacter butzleri]
MNNKENFIGYDPIDGRKIIVLGELKDKIHPKVEIKRGNEKELIEDIGHQITELGYSSHFFDKGNHIAFCNQKNDKDLYVIEWHYDADYKQENIVKKTCKELGLTYKQLGEKIGVSESTLLSIASTGKISKQIETAIELYKKTIELEEKLANSEKIKETLKEWLK